MRVGVLALQGAFREHGQMLGAIGVEVREVRRPEELAGLVSALDLIITPCCSLVHLAGALGKPVWVMTPKVAAWRSKSKRGIALQLSKSTIMPLIR